MSRRTRISLLIVLAVLLGGITAGVLYLRSDSFRRYVLSQVVAQIEQATGGRVEARALKWQLRPMQVELTGLVLHGMEGPGQPLVTAESLVIRLRLVSLLRRQIDWRLLHVENPVIFLLVDREGHTNFPDLKIKRTPGGDPVEKLWQLAIKRVEVHDGVFILNDQRIALDFSADDVQAGLNYRRPTDDYTGALAATVQLIPRLSVPDERPVTLPAKVQVELRVQKNLLEATNIEVSSARSVLRGAGRLTPFTSPKVDIDYTARLDAVEAALLGADREVRGGAFHVKGAFHYDIPAHVYTTAGDIRLERVELRGPGYNIPRVDGTASYTLTNSTYISTDFRAMHLYLFGGELTGEVHGDDQRGRFLASASTQIHNLSVARVREMIATSDFPFDRLPWVGSIEGTATARLRLASGRKNLREIMVSSDTEVRPPTVVPPGYAGVTGAVGLDYNADADLVSFRNVSLETAGSRIKGNGILDVARVDTRTSLAVDGTVTDMNEWRAFLAALRPGQPPLPLDVGGHVAFRGQVQGPLQSLAWKGHLEAADFRYQDRHWDAISGDLAYSPNSIVFNNGHIRRNGASVDVNLSAGLVAGRYAENGPLTIDARVHNAQLSDLQEIAGTSYAIDGQVNGNVHVTGSRANPRGEGAVQIDRGTLLQEPFESLRADLKFADQEVQAKNIALRRGPASITGEAAYRERDGAFRFNLAGSKIELASIRRLSSERIAVTGNADFQASGEGTAERPSINADAHFTKLVVNGEEVGTLHARMETRERELTARVQTELLRGSLVAEISARMEGDFPGHARVEFNGLDVDPLLADAVRLRLAAHSSVTGVITASGPFKQPERMTGAGTVNDFSIAFQQADFRNSGPLRVSLANGALRVEQAHMVGKQTDMNLAGTVKLMGPPAARTLGLRVSGAVNLVLLGAVYPGLDSAGQLQVDASVTGTISRPQLAGLSTIRGGNLAIQDVNTGFSNIEAALRFDARRVDIQDLKAQVGGGPVHVSGFINYADTNLPFFRLNATARDVRIRYPQGTSALLNGKLQLTGTTASSQLTGEVTVARVRFEQQFDLAQALGLSREPVTTPVSNPVLSNMRLDVRVTSSPEMRFEFAQARNLQMEANLRMRGTAARPSVTGRINLAAGEVTFAGTQYEVNRGDILFTNPFQIEPTISLSLSTHVSQYDIAIALSGQLDRLNVTYRSDPPLPSNDIQMMLLTGQTQAASSLTAPPSPTVPQIGANTILSQALNMAVTSRIERIFGVSRLKIDPQIGGPETSPGARVLLQQQVTQDVRFTYISNLSQTQQTVVQVEWQINDRWSVLAVRDENGLFGIDLRWRKRFH